MILKQITVFLLIAVLVLLSLPAVTFAEENTLIWHSEPLCPELDATNEELFRGYAEKTLYPERAASAFGISAGSQLNPYGKQLYNFLRTYMAYVANGNRASTVFSANPAPLTSIGLKTHWTYEELGTSNIDQDVLGAIAGEFWEQFEVEKVIYALLYDAPYEAYWFDKTTGLAWPLYFSIDKTSGVVTVSSFRFLFSVTKEYQAENYDPSNPAVDTNKTSATIRARRNAYAIRNCYAMLTDLEKLEAYKNAICSLVTYNHDAAAGNYDGGYGNPWQLIYVFDGDSSTNVVCEGYAKAFQYLCDISDFTGDVFCTTVSGIAGGLHMWNIITMENGKNYIADLTNSDSGTIGVAGGLFLSAAQGSPTEGYCFTAGGREIYYYYSDDTLALWGTDADSLLILSDSAYTSAEASREIVVQDAFRDKLTIEKSDNTDRSVKLEISPREGYTLPTLTLYTAIYNEDGSQKSVTRTTGTAEDGKITVNLPRPSVSEGETFNVLLWNDALAPLLLPIDGSRAFWKK